MFLGIFPIQSEYALILAGFTVAFILYAVIIRELAMKPSKGRWWLLVGILLRIALIACFPALSDDIYRFIWDGHLIHSGINPLSYTPEEWIARGPGESWDRLFPALNSPGYYTVYPPLSQVVFFLSTFVSMDDLILPVMTMKTVLLISDLGVLYFLRYFLKKYGMPAERAMIYFLNPLVLIELMGNAHFEGMYICLFLGCLYFIDGQRLRLSSFVYALAVACKLIPLMFLPIILKYLKPGKIRWSYLAGFVVFNVILFSSFIVGLDFGNFLSSLNLYFQTFEFNASLYYLLRYAGQLITGYNQIWIIGPMLAGGAVAIMLKRLFSADVSDIRDLFELSVFFFVVYLISATTVHPWYICLPIAFTVFRPRIYLLVWSFTIVFSYSLYAIDNWIGHYSWIFIEYGIVAVVYMAEKKKLIGWA